MHNLWRHNSHLVKVELNSEYLQVQTLLDSPSNVPLTGETILLDNFEALIVIAGHTKS